jgi:SNF2 family DNA or RNA helicase
VKTFGALRHADGAWVVTAEPHVVLKLKRVFPAIRPSARGSLHLSDTAETSRELEWFLERYPLQVDDGTLAQLRARAAAHREQESLFARLLAGVRAPRAFDLAIPPREYQRIAAELCLESGGLLCADDLGLGKTAVGICVISDPRARPALVVTLTHLPKQWEAEIRRFAPGLTTHVLRSSRPYDLRLGARGRAAGQAELEGLGPELPDVIITSYSKLAGWAETLAPIVRGVVYDEAQELRRVGSKNEPTKKAIAAQLISGSAAVRLALTATPIYNYGGEIFNVIESVRPGALGGRDEFIQEWCRTGGSADADKASIREPAAFGSFLRSSGLMLRRTRAEVGRELPELTKVPHHIDCEAKVLEEAEDAAVALARVLLSSDSTFEERGKAALELDWKVRHATGVAKAPHVADFVKILVEGGEKVVLYGWHRDVYDIWLERLKAHAPALYTGSESANQKAEAKRRFVEGETPILIMSLRAGAGLDGLQHHARTVVFGELDWSPGVHDQCAGRLHRDGQTEPVVAYYLITDEGSDPIVADVLGVKAAQATGIRDPNAPLVERLQNDGQHAKRLAEAYLARKGGRDG